MAMIEKSEYLPSSEYKFNFEIKLSFTGCFPEMITDDWVDLIYDCITIDMKENK
jgi:hypothetical protein